MEPNLPPESNLKSPASKQPRFNFFFFLMALWVGILIHDFLQYQKNVEMIPYSQFLSYLSAHQIEKVDVGSQTIEGSLRQAPKGHVKEFTTVRMEDPDLTQKLAQSGVTFSKIYESTFFKTILSWVVPALVFVGFWWLLISRLGRAKQDFLSFGKSKARIYAEKDIQTRFSDVAGVDEAKAELQEVVEFLKDPGRFSRLGGRMPKGILLIGPPGTGKTMLARAVAGEASVPFFSMNGSEFVELFVGMGAARVRDLFEQARAHSPCIIFVDELDALGRARGIASITGSVNDEKEQTLNQLLAELDGFNPAQGIILLGATNRPEVLDPALLRSGRFDRQILVPKPDRKGRESILAVHMKGIKTSPNVKIEVIASMTAGFSGADLANLANEAALVATRRRAELVELRDFTEALERMIAGLEQKNKLLSPDERRRVAFHEMGHAILALALGQGEAVHKVSIIPRGIGALGYTFRRPTEDRYLMSKRELENKMAILLGGRVAERIFFDDISTGAADDLDKATDIARAMVTRYGMSEGLGDATFEREPSPLLGVQSPVKTAEYSEETAKKIDHEVYTLIDHAHRLAGDCLNTYKGMMQEGAKLLIERETLEEEELKALWSRWNPTLLQPTAS